MIISSSSVIGFLWFGFGFGFGLELWPPFFASARAFFLFLAEELDDSPGSTVCSSGFASSGWFS